MAEVLNKTHWEQSMISKDQHIEMNGHQYAELNHDNLLHHSSPDNLQITSSNETTSTQQYLPPIPANVDMTSSNDGDYDADSNNEATPIPTTDKKDSLRVSDKDHLVAHLASHSEDSEVQDDPIELNAMRDHLLGLVNQEAQAKGMQLQINPQYEQIYGADPKENELISIYNQKSLQNVIQTIQQKAATPPASISADISPPQAHAVSPKYTQENQTPLQQQQIFESPTTIHPAVQKLYELQQQLLEKLQLLEKDDPDPQSAKLWNIMQRIFTEENAQQRQQNIADLTSTLEEKHKEVQKFGSFGDSNNLSVTDQKLLRSIHEMSKETKNELKEMRQQLNEERKKNNELRAKIRTKNRQLKVLSSEMKQEENDTYNYTISPMRYDPNILNNHNVDYKARSNNTQNVKQQLLFDDDESVSSFVTEKPNSFRNWCINMGFQPSEKKCSWF